MLKQDDDMKTFRNVSVTEFDELRRDGDAVVLDVRSPEELSEGEIPGYVMLNYFQSDFKRNMEALDKSKKYLVFCRSGQRSAEVCLLMAQLGFKNLYNLIGGIIAWKSVMF